MEPWDARLRNVMDNNEELLRTSVENRRPSVIVPTKAMLKQGAAPYPYQYHAQAQVVYASASTENCRRSQSGTRLTLSPPQDSQEKIVTPSSSNVHPQQTCCIIDKNQRCHQYVGRNVYNKGMQKRVKAIKSLQIKADSRARHIGMCDYHKTMIEEVIRKNSGKSRKPSNISRHSDDTESNDEDGTEVKSPGIDFSRFPLVTLQKYKKFFSIPGQLSKGQLTDAITCHFKTSQFSSVTVLKKEKDIIEDFFSTKRNTGGGGLKTSEV